MIDLGFINVAGAIVGQTFRFDWSAARIEPTLKQQGMNISDTLALYNESGVGFMVTMNQTSRTFTLPAGGWALDLPCTIPGGVDLSLTLTVDYILPSPAVSQVHADYFGPGENPLGASVVLGNSPINGAVSGVVASTLVNTGAPPGTNIITSNSSTAADGAVVMNNDGSGNRSLQSNGAQTIYESWTEGGPVTEATVVFGNAGDLAATTFNGTGNFNNTTIGTLVSAGGVATVGQWVSVAHQPGLHITANGLTTIASWPATSAGGHFRVTGTFTKNNATAANVTFQASFNDPFGGGAQTRPFAADIGGSVVVLDGSHAVGSQQVSCFGFSFAHTIGNTITVAYNDPTGTPNDWVVADIEQFVI